MLRNARRLEKCILNTDQVNTITAFANDKIKIYLRRDLLRGH